MSTTAPSLPRRSFAIIFAVSAATAMGPANTVFAGCSWKRKLVTTPKLPPPPCKAQRRPGFSPALARTNRQLQAAQAVIAANARDAVSAIAAMRGLIRAFRRFGPVLHNGGNHHGH